MTKEFEIRMAQKKQEDSQKRINCKETINKIFDQILESDSVLRAHIEKNGLDFHQFQVMLVEYRQALMDEVNFLPIAYLEPKLNHPLRAANALSNLNTVKLPEQFILNLDLFSKEANDSHFYPRARTVAAAIIDGLIFAAVVALVLFIFFPALPMQTMAILSAVAGFFMGCNELNTHNLSFRPIYRSKESGNQVVRFFSRSGLQLTDAQLETSKFANFDVDTETVDNAGYQDETNMPKDAQPPAYVLS